ncbi:MAG: class I SAM-dependent methyltransferase [Alphaproteobacteria bacterium]
MSAADFPLAHALSGTNPIVNDYDPIATIFDEVMGFDFHNATYALRRTIAERVLAGTPMHCLDLCCGTGLFLFELSKDFPIYGQGIDLSAGQIKVAQNRLSEQTHIRLRCENVLIARFPGNVDFVTINMDALNHLPTESWPELFKKVSNSLSEHGGLLFDYNLPERLAADWNAPEVIPKDHMVYIQLADEPVIVGNTITRRTPQIMFMRNEHGSFDRYDATVEHSSMPLKDTLQALHDAGLSRTEVIACEGSTPNGHLFNKNRAYILAQH